MPKEAKPKVRSSQARQSAQKEKASKKKDPNAPKKALSPYMFFTQEWREKIKEENPGIGFGEVAKRLGAKWKSMSDEEKEPYIEKHQADKKRAEDAKEAYELYHNETYDVTLQSKGKGTAASGDDDDD
ncbi:Non-histone chromosomal protein 6 [Serendipita sp. 399]|nr:Non-histone chromosomal protein 6 [Serendipita sp. 399]